MFCLDIIMINFKKDQIYKIWEEYPKTAKQVLLGLGRLGPASPKLGGSIFLSFLVSLGRLAAVCI